MQKSEFMVICVKDSMHLWDFTNFNLIKNLINSYIFMLLVKVTLTDVD